MAKFFKARSKKAGMPPGTLIHIGEKKPDKTIINVIDYDENKITEKQITDLNECFHYKHKPSVTWIDIEGLTDVNNLIILGKHYGLHSLVMEDVLNTDQRTKMEDYGEYIYFVVKMFYLHNSSNEIVSEQVSIILGNNFVITFQEGIEGDTFNNIRDRLRTSKGRIRKFGSDFLVYSLIDSIVDNYFSLLEKLGEKIEDVEEEVVAYPAKQTITNIYELKREMLFLRKSVWPLREVIASMEREETGLIKQQTQIYIRDIYDHTIHVIDTIETYRDMLSGMLDIYLSSISNRLNEVMKVLTIITTIFIPLSFIAGIYGMNFEFMPELHWKYSYPVVLGGMFIIAAVMLIFFKRKKWF
ncbi:MAG: magnesium/cobalt transporter CorA [Ignavibacteriae bacterium]|nr:MAG: magnesium/cobalt transporter CorA [Ignavibacteriota bacterium]